MFPNSTCYQFAANLVIFQLFSLWCNRSAGQRANANKLKGSIFVESDILWLINLVLVYGKKYWMMRLAVRCALLKQWSPCYDYIDKCSQLVHLYFQRYSVAVYLVRVFTAADLFSQLKLCSVENAERCRERSKCWFYICANGNKSVQCNFTVAATNWLKLLTVSFCRYFISSPRQTAVWSREWNCDYRPPGFPHLSSEYTFMKLFWKCSAEKWSGKIRHVYCKCHPTCAIV